MVNNNKNWQENCNYASNTTRFLSWSGLAMSRENSPFRVAFCLCIKACFNMRLTRKLLMEMHTAYVFIFIQIKFDYFHMKASSFVAEAQGNRTTAHSIHCYPLQHNCTCAEIAYVATNWSRCARSSRLYWTTGKAEPCLPRRCSLGSLHNLGGGKGRYTWKSHSCKKALLDWIISTMFHGREGPVITCCHLIYLYLQYTISFTAIFTLHFS